MIETHEDIVWEKCEATEGLHGRYRGFDLHQWQIVGRLHPYFICFYASEGEATFKETQELYDKISSPERYEMRLPKDTNHQFKGCDFKERFDGEDRNYCLEVCAPTLKKQLTKLDEIIDALWAQSGLKAVTPLAEGRWR